MFSRLLVRVTFPLAAANVMNQAARMVMAIVGPVLAVELGLSAVELGVLAASLFAAYAAAQLPLGVALDAFGARRVQTVLMLLAALGFAIFALSPGFAGLVAARIVLGVGISAGLMALIKAHADWFERSRVAHVTGIATAIGALGSALTTSPVQAMLPALGWRGVFWGLCLLAFAVATWIFLSVPDKPRVPGPARTLRGDIALSGRILASRTFWRFAPAVATLSMFNFAYLGLWAGPWLRDVAGMDGPARAGVLFVYTFAMVVGSMLAGSAASRANAAGLPPFFVPIVSLVFCVSNNRVSTVIGSFNEAYAKSSPGLLAFEYVVKWAFDRQYDVDFGSGAERYKQFWARGNVTNVWTLRTVASWWGRTGMHMQTLQLEFSGARDFIVARLQNLSLRRMLHK